MSGRLEDPPDPFLSKAIAGDPAALDALWRAHRRWVAAVLSAHGARLSDLDDLLQDVALTMVESLRALEDPAAFRPWLRAIALNAVRSAARKTAVRRRHHGSAPADDTAEAPRSDAADRAAARDEVARTLQHIDRMPSDLREVLLLRAVRGSTQREIAAALDLPETTVETRLARARRWLRQALPGASTWPPAPAPKLTNTCTPRTPP